MPLGGAGEIGMNLYLYGYGPAHDRVWLIVDMAGILVESRTTSLPGHGTTVIGFGVNVAAAPRIADKPTAALADFDLKINSQDLLRALQHTLSYWLNQWRAPAVSLHTSWMDRALPKGSQVRVHDPAGNTLSGYFLGITEQGCARVATDTNGQVTLHAGEMILR